MNHNEQNQIEAIKTILFDLHIVEMKEIKESFDLNINYDIIINLKEIFSKLSLNSIGMILNSLIKNHTPKEIINICDIVSKILSHIHYYSNIKTKREYTNDYWDTYIIKKKKHLYFLIDYMISDSFPSKETKRPVCFDNNSKDIYHFILYYS